MRTTLSPTSRYLTWLNSLAYLAIGLLFFSAPSWSADHFPWKVSSLVAMTTGAWCLGNAIASAYAAYVWDWTVVRQLLVQMWIFGVLELGVLVWFSDKLRTGEWPTWPYVAALGISVIAGVVGVVDWWRSRPRETPGTPIPRGYRIVIWVFEVFVALIAVSILFANDGAQHRSIFPEVLSPFTVRAFGAFYASLVGGFWLHLRRGTMRQLVATLVAGQGWVVLITLACLPYRDSFDVSDHPGQLAVYVGAYVGVFLGSAWVVGRYYLRQSKLHIDLTQDAPVMVGARHD